MQHGVENTAKVVKHSKTVVKHSKTVVKHCKTLQKLFSGGPQMGPWWLLAGLGWLARGLACLTKIYMSRKPAENTRELQKPQKSQNLQSHVMKSPPPQPRNFLPPWGQGEL